MSDDYFIYTPNEWEEVKQELVKLSQTIDII